MSDTLTLKKAAAAPVSPGDFLAAWVGGKADRTLRGLLLPILLLGLLEIAARKGWVEARLLPPPSEIGATLWQLAQGDLWSHIGASLARVSIGFVIGSVLGLAVAVLVGLNRTLEDLLDPTFQALRNVPSLAWVPLLLLWFGIDEAPKITMIALGAFFPVYLNVVCGLQNVDRKLIEVGEIHGLGKFELARRILLPASLPSVFTGLRTALGLAWMFLVAAELIAASKGLGYLLSDGRETSRPDLVIAAIFLIALLGKVSDSALAAIEVRSLYWRDTLRTRKRRHA
ncbi:ABC transporter permease [Ferriphaselus sp. R-1]|uniref:ABC transporter permease n=1 Tax=Ferriphaselus sp. R-1 TaxID=1485544 RepID=UPI0009DF0EF0|nr:ABC transporter permease [Ferriphaselus sp. R-1]